MYLARVLLVELVQSLHQVELGVWAVFFKGIDFALPRKGQRCRSIAIALKLYENDLKTIFVVNFLPENLEIKVKKFLQKLPSMLVFSTMASSPSSTGSSKSAITSSNKSPHKLGAICPLVRISAAKTPANRLSCAERTLRMFCVTTFSHNMENMLGWIRLAMSRSCSVPCLAAKHAKYSTNAAAYFAVFAFCKRPNKTEFRTLTSKTPIVSAD